MSNRRVVSLAGIVALGIACVSADALAARVAAGSRGAAVGVRGPATGYRGAAGYRGGYYRPGVGVAAGALVGGAVAAASPWYGYNGYGYGGYGYGGYGYSNSYAPAYASSYGQGDSTDRFIDSRTKTYYDDYCKQRFKSYDSSSGTYKGDDGVRYRCP
jgi:hypothetical protein